MPITTGNTPKALAPGLGRSTAAQLVPLVGTPLQQEKLRTRTALQFKPQAQHNDGGMAFHDGRATAFR